MFRISMMRGRCALVLAMSIALAGCAANPSRPPSMAILEGDGAQASNPN